MEGDRRMLARELVRQEELRALLVRVRDRIRVRVRLRVRVGFKG